MLTKEDKESLIEKYSELFNIDNVSEEEIKQASCLEYYFFNRPAIDNPLNEYLIETINKIYSIKETKNALIGKYNLSDWQIKVVNREHHNVRIIKFIVILPENQELIENIKNDLDKLGYYFISLRNISYKGSEKFKGYIFEPYNHKNIELYDCEKQRYVKYSIWDRIKSKILSLFKR